VAPIQAVCNVFNYNTSTRLLALTSLRTILGTYNLAEILSEREQIGKDIQANLEKSSRAWGVDVSETNAS
jgi:erythrocyte band 7 integral membrane protein